VQTADHDRPRKSHGWRGIADSSSDNDVGRA